MTRRYRKRASKGLYTVFVMIILCISVFIALFAQPKVKPSNNTIGGSGITDGLSVIAIDVGQGDSILVTTDTGEVMLIDAGEVSASKAIFEELDERGISRIDILVATHPHADHIGGMYGIINRYDIGTVYMPDMAGDSETYRKLKNTIKTRKIPLVEAYAGEQFSLGQAQCTIVSPNKNDDIDANNESIAIYLDYCDTECLFTGDMEQAAEERLLASGYTIDADILKIAHHGSSTGTTEDFLYAVSPDYAVISCGKDNTYGHPHQETLDLLQQYGINPFRTDLSGDISFFSDGYSVKTATGD